MGTPESPRLSFPDALSMVTATIVQANPGNTIVVDRHHVDHDGRYFSVTVTTRERIRSQVLAEIGAQSRDDDNLNPREAMVPLRINGIKAAEFIKRAFGLGIDLSGAGRYDQKDPVQTELRAIKGWIEMAERDALDARSDRDMEGYGEDVSASDALTEKTQIGSAGVGAEANGGSRTDASLGVDSSAACECCGLPEMGWVAKDDHWNAVMGSYDAGHICPRCFTRRSEALGVPVRWTAQCGDEGPEGEPEWIAHAKARVGARLIPTTTEEEGRR